MRIIAGILLYLIVVMLITIKTLYDDNDDIDIEMNFLNAFLIANLTILIAGGISVVCIVLSKIIITGTI